MPLSRTTSKARLRKHARALLINAIGLQLLLLPALGQMSLGRLAQQRTTDFRVSMTCSTTIPVQGQTVYFKGVSTASVRFWLWDFGDGYTSTRQDEAHTFRKAGFFRVTLTATTSTGSKKALRTFTVLSSETSASFVHSPTTPGVGQTVMFADTTPGDPTAWSWNFGDGTTSAVKNPSHAFAAPGSYTVTLVSANASSSRRVSKTLTVASMSILSASFSYSPTSPSMGESVQFTDTSTGNPTAWLWSFGDGSTSTLRNPSHVFTAAGSYNVSLKTTNGTGSKTSSLAVTVSAKPSPSFTYSPAIPAVGQAVQFTDASVGSPSSWLWDFGDGSTSADRNPRHAFSSSGTYSVTLAVSNLSGSQSITKSVPVGSGPGTKNIYWVSPTGAAAWEDARSDTPLAGVACASLSTANARATAGDTVYLRGGSYCVNTSRIQPAHSGTAEARILFAAYPGETPAFYKTDDGSLDQTNHAIRIIGKSYIVVDGMTGSSLARWIYISTGACYNEIRNCRFSTVTYDCAIRIWDYATAPSTDNWIHHNVFERVGFVSTAGQDVLSMMQIDCDGSASRRTSSHNTIEDNLFSYGGHDCTETYSKFNVIKNNFYHNEGWMRAPAGAACRYAPDSNGLYGNRNIQISGDRTNTGMFNLLEGNRFGASGATPDDDGGDALTITAPSNIVRYNEILNGQNNGILLKIDVAARSDNNRIYNNTIVWNGRYNNSNRPGYIGGQWLGYGIVYYANQVPAVGNVIKNNLLYGNAGGDVAQRVWPPHHADTVRDNTWDNNWRNADGDPLFVDPMHSDLRSPVRPNLALRAGSGAIDRGTHLTRAKGAGTNSVTLVVDDALFFQDGTWGSALTRRVTLFPDRIAIGTVTHIAEIASIDYATNTITLASPTSWTDRAKIWLNRDSSGRGVLAGRAPDLGAHESSPPPSAAR